MHEINVGIVGYGFIGKVHAYSYINMPMYYDNLPFKIRIVGIADANEKMLEKARNEIAFVIFIQQIIRIYW